MSQAWNNIANLRGPTGLTGSPGTSFTFRNAWVSTTAYAVNDVVTRLGSTYINIVANTGSDPNTDGGVNWAILAQAGTSGAQGIPGTTGATGVAGSKCQPSVANAAALPTLPAAGYSVGDFIFTADGNLFQITGP
jgi:hypothetical protein